MRALTQIAAIALGVALAVVAAVPAPAPAALAPIQLISKSASEQAEEASEPALSADGRFVAFSGTIEGLRGIFRKDLTSGAIDPVAVRDAYSEAGPLGNAQFSAPSISADGRYVSFTTTARLDPANDQVAASSDVYVRDMARAVVPAEPCPGGEACAYEIASALDGCEPAQAEPHPPCGLTYASPVVGSFASGRVALSASGRRVAFVTRTESTLLGKQGDPVSTPAWQVALRDLDAGTTTLVSARRDPTTGQVLQPPEPVPGGAVLHELGAGASLSADGTTVAWPGIHLPAQVAVLPGEKTSDESYNEPLWRRVADGPLVATRRIVGGGDPAAPDCPPDGTLADAACQGPFDLASPLLCQTDLFGWERGVSGKSIDGIPQLSADGRTVATIGQPNGFSNLFVVDMAEGLSRRQAIQPLTREVPVLNPCEVGNAENIAGAGDFFDLAISPDGRRIAFVTARRQFPLSPPNLAGMPPPPALGLTELYLVDLDAETLQRVTHAVGGTGQSLGPGSPGAPGASSPSFSGDGRTLAFASKASNLVVADANDASDAFLVTDSPAGGGAGEDSISPSPPSPLPRSRRRLVLSASSEADGSVRLAVLVPGAGTLRVRADADPGARAGARRVASARRQADRGRVLVLRLEPSRRFHPLVRSKDGLEATLVAGFAQPGLKPLRRRLEVRFRSADRAPGRSEGGRAR